MCELIICVHGRPGDYNPYRTQFHFWNVLLGIRSTWNKSRYCPQNVSVVLTALPVYINSADEMGSNLRAEFYFCLMIPTRAPTIIAWVVTIRGEPTTEESAESFSRSK